MVFRDDRDALLAQADALRVQLDEAETRLVEAERAAAAAKQGDGDGDEDEARMRSEIERLRGQVDDLRATNAQLREDVIPADAAPLPERERPAPLPPLIPEPLPVQLAPSYRAPMPAPLPSSPSSSFARDPKPKGSVGWLVFWLLAFFPVGVFYLVTRSWGAASRAPSRPEAELPAGAFGSVLRGPAPELPPPGNPGLALLACLGIVIVAIAFALIALS